MAETPEGRVLTDEHRRWQARLSAAVAEAVVGLGAGVDPAHVGRGVEAWLGEMLGLAVVAHDAASSAAVEYVREFRVAEMGASGLPVSRPGLDLGDAADAVLWAPRAAEAAVREGCDPVEAWDVMVRRLAGRWWRESGNFGREVVSGSALEAGFGWRRVSDGDPCAWCAMLVAAGPVYKTATAALKPAGRRSAVAHPERFHDYCGCSVEEFRGSPGDWLGSMTAAEEALHGLYVDAGGPGMSARDVVRGMRARGRGVLSDATKEDDG
jgi:hypothetical protein